MVFAIARSTLQPQDVDKLTAVLFIAQAIYRYAIHRVILYSAEAASLYVQICTIGPKGLRVQTTYVMFHPRAIILPRSTKKHTQTVSTKPFEAATCSNGLCVQLYNRITHSKKENTKISVIFMPTLLFFSKKKFISATAHQLNQALRASFDVFYYIITLSFC